MGRVHCGVKIPSGSGVSTREADDYVEAYTTSVDLNPVFKETYLPPWKLMKYVTDFSGSFHRNFHEPSMEVDLTSMEVPWKVNFHEREFERCLTSMKEVYVILISASMKAAMYFRGGSAWKTCASANAHTKP